MLLRRPDVMSAPAPVGGPRHMSAPYMCTHVITYICNTCGGVRGDSLVNLDLTFQTRRSRANKKSTVEIICLAPV